MTFLDTGFLFALVSKKDAHHARLVEVFRTFRNLRLADHLLTTNHVIAETITLTLRVGHTEAARIGEQLYAEKLARSIGRAQRKSEPPSPISSGTKTRRTVSWTA